MGRGGTGGVVRECGRKEGINGCYSVRLGMIRAQKLDCVE